MADVECTVCGGTDFYKESGHYYCNECQTQTQELQEHVFQDETQNIKSTKKLKTPTKDKSESKITSWECWNIILFGLTQELVKLGANEDLTQIVKCLWMKYLEKMQVINIKNNVLPKVQINAKKDCAIIYELKKKKRKRYTSKSSSDESATPSSIASIKRERARKKRALVQSQYEDFSKKSTQESSTLHNETLTSLKSSEKSEKISKINKYNYTTAKELRKRVSGHHYRKHIRDFQFKMKCHQHVKSLSRKYQNMVLSTNKIYCILYLGLLINKDQIQLGDFLRFIREGHLSYNYFTHFFPDEYQDKSLNLSKKKTTTFSNKYLRKTTAELAKFLGVEKHVQVPNIVLMAYRFCYELNLPDQLRTCVVKIIAQSKPRLCFLNNPSIIPNYEGRVMSTIIFTLKLLFGLDGLTEFELAKYSNLINKATVNESKMFNIITWLKHLEYRKHLIGEYHFPTQYFNDSTNINSDMLLQHWAATGFQQNEHQKLSKEPSDYKQLLEKMRDNQPGIHQPFEFPASLTPFFDYTQVLLKFAFKDKSYLDDLLRLNCNALNLDFLLKPDKFLKVLGNKDVVIVKNGGANNNWIISSIKNPKNDQKKKNLWRKKLVNVSLVDEKDDNYLDETQVHETPENIDSEKFLREHHMQNRKCFANNVKQSVKFSKGVKINLQENKFNLEELESYEQHFNPFERYWMNYRMYVDWCGKDVFRRFLSQYPYNFRIILDDCARIIEQTDQELFFEFQFTEVYLAYVANYDMYYKVKDRRLKNFIKQAEKNW